MSVRAENTSRILLFSGKRKSGKDFITEKLLAKLDDGEIIRISEPIKSFWAKEKNLDLQQLLSDGAYKEKFRKDMINWSDQKRAEDYGIFCRAASKDISKSVVIVSDVRRRGDIKYFREEFGDRIKLIRVKCDDKVRQERGWKFETGVDDVQSECDLDEWNEWDLIIENSGNRNTDEIIQEIINKLVDN